MRTIIFIVGLISFTKSGAQQAKMDFEKYDPVSTLVVPEHGVTRAKFPFIDVHNHQFQMPTQNLRTLITEMDKLNMAVMVNLSGRSGKELAKSLTNVKDNYPQRFIVFANVDFNGVGSEGWAEKAARQLEDDVKAGANGLKIYKNLGFTVKDVNGKRVAVDDPRLNPIWKKAGELKIPVLIHTADPKPFWDEKDEHNERWLELETHPERKKGADNPEPWETLIEEQHRLFKNNPQTTFIAAHFGWYANDLKKLGQLLDELPNVLVEFGAVIAELGRQPRMAKQFFTQYQDRILFGKDSWVPEEYATYFRVLETEDEYFPYHKKYHAFWKMYGIGLSDDILKKVYYKNAIRIIPGIDKTLFPN
ncbi:MAG TPA: amidohydrolase family protein [Chitinophagaceae bacterium]|nr:amidohydrolase family protein [Chitinophagaceae bacterium]